MSGPAFTCSRASLKVDRHSGLPSPDQLKQLLVVVATVWLRLACADRESRVVIVVVACLSLILSFSLSSFTRLLLWPSPLSVDFLAFCLGVSWLGSRVRVLPVLGTTPAIFGQTMVRCVAV